MRFYATEALSVRMLFVLPRRLRPCGRMLENRLDDPTISPPVLSDLLFLTAPKACLSYEISDLLFFIAPKAYISYGIDRLDLPFARLPSCHAILPVIIPSFI